MRKAVLSIVLVSVLVGTMNEVIAAVQTGYLEILFGTGTQNYFNIEDNTYTSTANRNGGSELELLNGLLHTTCNSNALAIPANQNFDGITSSDFAAANYNQLTVTPSVGLVFFQKANLGSSYCSGPFSGNARFVVTGVVVDSNKMPIRVDYRYEYQPDSGSSVTTTTTGATTTTVSNTTTTTISAAGPTLVLSVGWNLVGNGVEAPLNVATVLSNASKINTVWKWVTSGTTPGATYPAWAFYTPTQPDGGAAYAASKGYEFLTTINAGEGFWVNAATSFATSLPAGALVQSKSFMPGTGAHALPIGWSLIATGDGLSPNQFDISIATADAILATPPTAGGSAGLPIALTSLWAWNPVQTAWYFMAPSLVNSGGLANYNVLKGYLDFSTLPGAPAGTLSPTTGFWVNRP